MVERPMSHDPEPLLTSRQAAKFARVSTQALRAVLQRKELLAYKVGSQWRINKRQLTQWLQRRKRVGTQGEQTSNVVIRKMIQKFGRTLRE